ncbi:MAG: 16S rRNA (guanine(527)-N(7))-methyltransferase RsmG [Burkholderiaceae bacterium]|nr:16S rRNA (guanine(527)-N(7))-methyltransferase RsmG [Burkholderiaceae bacterium]
MSAPQTQSASTFSIADFLHHTLHALDLNFNARQTQQLLDYTALLQRWNRVFNLTAVRDLEGIARLHLADCLAALPAFQRAAPRRLLDVGSGGGLPGIVLAIGLPETEVHLIDTVQKKCAFLQQTCGSLALRQVSVHHARVESLQDAAGFDCITSRAFSDLPLLVQSTRHLLAADGQWCAMKGQHPADEIAALPPDLAARIEALQVPGLDAQRCLVWLQAQTSDRPESRAAFP